MKKILPPICLMFCALSSSHAQDQVDLEETRVFGNRDQPNITYVVPWKDEELEVVDMQPVTDFFDNALQPLDREVFLREMEHLDRLQKQR